MFKYNKSYIVNKLEFNKECEKILKAFMHEYSTKI